MSFITSPGVIFPPLTAGGVAYGTGSQAKISTAGILGQYVVSGGAGVPTFTDLGTFTTVNCTNLVSSGTLASSFTVTGGTAVPLTITNVGTGNSFVVEDSANPDVSPFVIDASGNVSMFGRLNQTGSNLLVLESPQTTLKMLVGQSTSITSAFGENPIVQVSQVRGTSSGNPLAVYTFGADNVASAITMAKSRGATLGTQAIVLNGDQLGVLYFCGSDGTNMNQVAASIIGAVDGTPGASPDMPGRLVFSTTADGASSPTERMRISNAGLTSLTGTFSVTGVSTFAAGTAALPSLTTTGDTNTGIFFPAADTVGVTTGGTERLRVISTGEVGIGATPTTASKALIVNTSAGASTIALSLQNVSDVINTETALELVATNAGTGVRSTQITALNVSGGTGVNMVFKISNGTPPAEAMRITSVGGLQLTRGVGVSNTTPRATGVSFPATAVAPGDANTLGDYEEGTWTPVVTFTTTNGDLTTATALGVYTKIGRLVQIAFNVVFSETTASGNFTITGVPFTSGNNSISTSSGCYVDNTTITGSPVVVLPGNSSTITIYQTRTGAGTPLTNANTAASSVVFGSLSYSV